RLGRLDGGGGLHLGLGWRRDDGRGLLLRRRRGARLDDGGRGGFAREEGDGGGGTDEERGAAGEQHEHGALVLRGGHRRDGLGLAGPAAQRGGAPGFGLRRR